MLYISIIDWRRGKCRRYRLGGKARKTRKEQDGVDANSARAKDVTVIV